MYNYYYIIYDVVILSGDSSGGIADNRDSSKQTPHGHNDAYSTAAQGTVNLSLNDIHMFLEHYLIYFWHSSL